MFLVPVPATVAVNIDLKPIVEAVIIAVRQAKDEKGLLMQVRIAPESESFYDTGASRIERHVREMLERLFAEGR